MLGAASKCGGQWRLADALVCGGQWRAVEGSGGPGVWLWVVEVSVCRGCVREGVCVCVCVCERECVLCSVHCVWFVSKLAAYYICKKHFKQSPGTASGIKATVCVCVHVCLFVVLL